MTYFLKIFGMTLAIAAAAVAISASLAVPLILALNGLPYPYAGIVTGVYVTLWFCVFVAAVITLDTWDQRDD